MTVTTRTRWTLRLFGWTVIDIRRIGMEPALPEKHPSCEGINMNNYRWTVQAHAPGHGWKDYCHAEHRTKAEQDALALRLNESIWRGFKNRQVRIVPYTGVETTKEHVCVA